MLPLVVVLAFLVVPASGFRFSPQRLSLGVRGAARGAAAPVREQLRLFAATYIELVPPMPKNRMPPELQPPPVRYSSQEWFMSMVSIYKSYILRRIAPQLSFTVFYTTVMCCLSQWTPFIPVITDFNIWFLMGSVLSLLLVFRTNSAYDRFWEARRQMGSVVTISRSLARIASYSAPDSATKERVGLLLTAFPRFLVSHLEGDFTVQPEIAAVVGLRSQDIRMVLASRNRPFRCAQLLGSIITENMDDMAVWGVEKQLVGTLMQELIDVIGSCERIVGCPVPLAYSKHTSRFLSFFTFSLPLVLMPGLGWCTIGMMSLSSWAMYGIDEIGHLIENPFNKEVSQDLLDIARIHSSIESDAQDALSYVFLTNKAAVVVVEEERAEVVSVTAEADEAEGEVADQGEERGGGNGVSADVPRGFIG